MATRCATLTVCNALPSLHSRVGRPCAAAPHAQGGEGLFHVQIVGNASA
jgi:hypothetical protein